MPSSAKSNSSMLVVLFKSYLTTARHPSHIRTRRSDDVSTGNLNRHIRECDPVATLEHKVMAKFVAGCTYTQERFRFQLALWVVQKCRPYAIVEDEELGTAFRMLHGSVEVPSRFSVIRDINMMYGMTKARLIAWFEVCVGYRDSGLSCRSHAKGFDD